MASGADPGEVEELRRRLADAEAAGRLKERFLVMLAHELKAPLAAILLWEEVLRARIDDPEARTRALQAIRQAALSEVRIVEDLIDVTRAMEGRLHLERAPLPLSPLILGAVERARPTAEARGVLVEARLDHPLGEVLGDERRLAQVLSSLLERAVKRSERGARVELAAARLDGTVEVVVRDRGRGMDPELLARALDWFAAAGGPDLSLALVRPVVALHGGEVQVAASDGATVFTLRLPLALGGVQAA